MNLDAIRALYLGTFTRVQLAVDAPKPDLDFKLPFFRPVEIKLAVPLKLAKLGDPTPHNIDVVHADDDVVPHDPFAVIPPQPDLDGAAPGAEDVPEEHGAPQPAAPVVEADGGQLQQDNPAEN